MNRLFGTKAPEPNQPAPAQPAQAPPQQQQQHMAAPPKTDLYEQSQKMDNRIDDMTNKIKELDTEIKDLYMKAKNSRGAEQKFVKQRLLNLLKKRKMYEGQVGHYYSAQNNLNNIAFTNENIQNTIDMAQCLKETNQVQQNAMKAIGTYFWIIWG